MRVVSWVGIVMKEGDDRCHCLVDYLLCVSAYAFELWVWAFDVEAWRVSGCGCA